MATERAVESAVISEIGRKYLRLTLCPDVGPIRLANLLRELGGIDEVLGASVARLQSVERVGPKVAEGIARTRDKADVDGEVALAEKHDARIVCLADEQYPLALSRINDPPPCLYIRGMLVRQDIAALAIVGSRACTHYGAEQAERFGALIAGTGLTVVSGMARGIDSAAHRGALAAGGRTLAVLGCGLCYHYPPDSVELAARIVERGAILSELPMRTAPDAKNFPPRNRIIIGLSMGVLIVEAARRSGALITARLAVEYGREVFALAGRVDTPQAEGCLELIKQGSAKLVTRLEDILAEFGEAGAALQDAARPSHPAERSVESSSLPPVALDAPENRIVTALDRDALGIDALCERTGLPPARVAVALTGLQLKGLVRRLAGETYERTGKRAS